MKLFLDLNSIQLIQVAEDKPAILCENFSWLLNNLYNFEPNHTTSNEKWKQAGRGNRRAQRGDDSTGLGYEYKPESDFTPGQKKPGVVSYMVSMFKKFMDSPDTTITKKGYKTIESFGYPFEVEEWTVTAPWPVTDHGKGETYEGPDGGVSYTCEITSRRELEDGKKSRYYVSCNCKDFHYSFKQDLQDAGYTNPLEVLPARGSGPTGKVAPHAPAICKHIYAILMKFYYDDFISKEKASNANPEIGTGGILGKVKDIFSKGDQSDSFNNYTATLKSQDQLKAAIAYITSKLGLKSNDKYSTPVRPSNAFKLLVDKSTNEVLKTQLTRLKKELETRETLNQNDLNKAKKSQLAILKTQTQNDKNIPVKDLSNSEKKKRAERAIINALQTADINMKSDIIDSYEDSRRFSSSPNAPRRFYKYKFEVRIDSADGKAAIYYINSKQAGKRMVPVDGYTRKTSYYLFTPMELRALIQKYTASMPSIVKNQIEKLKKQSPVLMFEACEVSYEDGFEFLRETNSITSAISLLKGTK